LIRLVRKTGNVEKVGNTVAVHIPNGIKLEFVAERQRQQNRRVVLWETGAEIAPPFQQLNGIFRSEKFGRFRDRFMLIRSPLDPQLLPQHTSALPQRLDTETTDRRHLAALRKPMQ